MVVPPRCVLCDKSSPYRTPRPPPAGRGAAQGLKCLACEHSAERSDTCFTVCLQGKPRFQAGFQNLAFNTGCKGTSAPQSLANPDASGRGDKKLLETCRETTCATGTRGVGCVEGGDRNGRHVTGVGNVARKVAF